MAKEMPLLAELTNCLNSYQETFGHILESIQNQSSDSVIRIHDSPIIIQLQDLLSIEAEFQRHLQRMDKWGERQEKIQNLEQELDILTKKVNDFTNALNIAQNHLGEYLASAKNLQKETQQKHFEQGSKESQESIFSWIK